METLVYIALGLVVAPFILILAGVGWFMLTGLILEWWRDQ